MFKWLAKYRSKQGINDLPSEEERARLRPPPPSPTNTRIPVVRKGSVFIDDDGRELLVIRDCYAGEVISALQFIYSDTGEHPEGNRPVPKSLVDFLNARIRKNNGE